ncbi:MAG: peptidyl-prolyl cis-trans isomerase C [Myxococcota bacterium]
MDGRKLCIFGLDQHVNLSSFSSIDCFPGRATTGLGLFLGISALVCTALVGCKPERPANEDRQQEARARVALAGIPGGAEDPVADKKGGLTEQERNLVVAKVGDVTITLGDVESQLSSQPAFARARFRSFDKKVEFLNNLVQFELLAMEAQAKGYDTDPDVVLAMKRAMIQEYTQNDLQKLVTAASVTDEDVARYYENNRPMFQKEEQIRVSHILFENQESADKGQLELQSAIKADPARSRQIFSDFARRLSKDIKTDYVNGDLNFFTKAGYVDPSRAEVIRLPDLLVETAFAISGVNEISKVIKTEQGWHILQLTNRRPAVNRAMADAKRQITNILLRERKDAARQKFIADLRAKAKVEVFEDKLKLIDVSNLKKAVNPAHPALPLTAPAKVDKKPAAAEKPAEPAEKAPTGAKAAPKLHDPIGKRALLDPKKAHLPAGTAQRVGSKPGATQP